MDRHGSAREGSVAYGEICRPIESASRAPARNVGPHIRRISNEAALT